jgi:hypothetical protein
LGPLPLAAGGPADTDVGPGAVCPGRAGVAVVGVWIAGAAACDQIQHVQDQTD